MNHLVNYPNANLTINKEEDAYSGALANPMGECQLNDLVIETKGFFNAMSNYQGYAVEMSAVFDGTFISGQNSVQGRIFYFTGEKVK